MSNEPSISNEEIQEVKQLIGTLTDLKEKVSKVSDSDQTKAYGKAFALIQHYHGFSNKVSNESFSKGNLLNEIDSFKSSVESQLSVNLEAYVTESAEDIKEAVARYNRSVDLLDQIDDDIKVGGNKVIKLDSKRVWDMFHVNGKMQTDAIPAINIEINNLNDIIDTLERYVRNLYSRVRINSVGKTSYQLMFNRRVDINNDSLAITQKPVPAPKDKDNYTAGGVGGIAVSIGTSILLGFLNVPFARSIGSAAGLVTSPLLKKAFGTNERIQKNDLNTLHSLVKKIQDLDRVVIRLNSLVSDTEKALDEEKIDQATYANVVITVNKLINHITDITNATGIAFSKIK